MDSIAEPARETPDLVVPEWVQAQISALQFQLAERDAELKRRELKIQKLTLELAHHKRIRFGCKSEALSPEQRDLFLEASDEDGAAIARALLKNPPLLVFDEATSSLDSKTEQAIQASIESASQGRTTLVIAHRLSTVMNADGILVMDAGRIVERGTHPELIAANGRYAQMWALQQREEERAANVAEATA